MRRQDRKNGTWLIRAGVLLIAAALLLIAYNVREDARAGRTAGNALERLIGVIGEQGARETLPGPETDGDLQEVEWELDGEWYLGILTLPSIDRQLPVYSRWSYPALKKAPCRYLGTAAGGDLILAAHNYESHFGLLKKLHLGDEVFFTDGRARVFCYEVADVEEMDGTAVEEMEAGEWDLTLFTCTLGGKSRLAVRCRLVV